MTDPFSISLGVLAVVGASKGLVSTLAKLRNIQEAPEQIAALINEISDLQAVLTHVGTLDTEWANDENSQVHKIAIKHHVDRAEAQLLMLDSIIKKHEKGNGKKEILASRVAWMRTDRKKVLTIKEELKNVRINLATSISAVTFFRVSRVQLSVQSVQAEQSASTANMTQIFQGLITQVARISAPTPEMTGPTGPTGIITAPSLHSPDSKVQVLCNVPQNQNIEPEKQSRPTLAGTMICVNASTRVTRNHCDTLCGCICHTRSKFGVSTRATSIFGKLFIGYTGLPVLTPECDGANCRVRSNPSILVRYFFPTWFLHRVLSMNWSLTSMGEVQMNLKMPRMVDWTSRLWRVVQNGDVPGMQTMFDLGQASPADVNISGESPLHYVAMQNRLDICSFLIDTGADPYLEDRHGRTPIDIVWASVYSKRLMPPDDTSVSVVFRDKDYADTREFSPLHKIVLGLTDRSLIAELKLSTQDINNVDANKMTALAWAASRKDFSAVATLLTYKADPNVVDMEGRNALFHATIADDVESVQLLLRNGVNARVRNAYGWTPIHSSCVAEDSITSLPHLLSAGIDINAADTDQDTALHMAIERGREKIVKYLLANDADFECPNSAGETAMYIALHNDRATMLKDILNRGANTSRRNHKQQTILHVAARAPAVACFAVLKNADMSGIDPEARDDEDQTAEDYFKKRVIERSLGNAEQDAFWELLEIVEKQFTGTTGLPGENADLADDNVEFEDACQFVD